MLLPIGSIPITNYPETGPDKPNRPRKSRRLQARDPKSSSDSSSSESEDKIDHVTVAIPNDQIPNGTDVLKQHVLATDHDPVNERVDETSLDVKSIPGSPNNSSSESIPHTPIQPETFSNHSDQSGSETDIDNEQKVENEIVLRRSGRIRKPPKWMTSGDWSTSTNAKVFQVRYQDYFVV
jgi:hypothetical protein